MRYDDCEIGRNVEIGVAKMQGDIKYIRDTQIKVLDKLDTLDDKYARKVIESRMTYVVGATITTLMAVIGFLIKEALF